MDKALRDTIRIREPLVLVEVCEDVDPSLGVACDAAMREGPSNTTTKAPDTCQNMATHDNTPNAFALETQHRGHAARLATVRYSPAKQCAAANQWQSATQQRRLRLKRQLRAVNRWRWTLDRWDWQGIVAIRRTGCLRALLMVLEITLGIKAQSRPVP